MFYFIWLKKQKQNEFEIINAELQTVGFSDCLKHIRGRSAFLEHAWMSVCGCD